MKQTYRYLLILLTFLAANEVFGSAVDSIEQLLSRTHDIEKKIKLHTLLVKHYQVVDIPKAKATANRALNLSVTSQTDKYLGEIYGLLGDIAVVEDSMNLAKQYYEIALDEFYAQNDLNGATGVAMVLGNIAFVRDDLATAMQFYLKAIDLASTAGLETWLPSVYLNIGSIHFKAGQNKMAQQYFSDALEGFNKNGNELLAASAYDNLGMTYLDMGAYEIAQDYFQKALSYHQEKEQPLRAAKVLHNMSSIAYRSGDYQASLNYLYKARTYIEKGNPNYAGPKQPLWAYNKVATGINQLHLKDYQNAYRNMTDGIRLSEDFGQLYLTQQAAKNISAYWEELENADSALHYFKVFKHYTDSLNNEENIRKLAYQEARAAYEKDLLIEKQQRALEVSQHKRQSLIMFVAITGLFLLLVVLLLLLKLSRNRTKQAELERKNLKQELTIRNKELTTHLMYQVKKNEFILSISKRLKDLLSSASPENQGIVNKLIKEIEFDSSADQWEEFEIRFQQVHTDFYKNLGKRFPDLTSNELRLCAFLRLNMNTKDIAAITYQSTNSITVARWRLRQKFGLQKEESLSAFLAQF
jgi:tetratricopeptide (TPR) repeat protein